VDAKSMNKCPTGANVKRRRHHGLTMWNRQDCGRSRAVAVMALERVPADPQAWRRCQNVDRR